MISSTELMDRAREAMEKAYAPYSHFKVGAALLTAEGRIYTGCNIENISYGVTVCAERTAIFKAVSEGERNFLRIAIASSDDKPAFPCGICRQVMEELMPEGEVIVGNSGEVSTYRVGELMPHSFNNEF